MRELIPIETRQGDELGGAMVEFVICSMVMIPMLLYSHFFYELMLVRLRIQEATRYATWEMTMMPQKSDYEGAAAATYTPPIPGAPPIPLPSSGRPNPDERFNQHSSQVLGELNDRYGDDGDSITPNFTPTGPTWGRFLMLTPFISYANTWNLPAGTFGLLSGALAGNVSGGGLDMGLNDLVQRFGFDTKGLAITTVAVALTAKFIPYDFLNDRFTVPFLQSGVLVLRPNVEMVLANAWELEDGSTVPQYGENTVFGKEVERIAFLGMFDNGSLDEAGRMLGQLSSFGGFDNPLRKTRVASLAADSFQGTPSATGQANAPWETLEVDQGIGVHATLPLRGEECSGKTNPSRCGYDESNFTGTWKKRGNFFMGCPDAQMHTQDCQWRN